MRVTFRLRCLALVATAVPLLAACSSSGAPSGGGSSAPAGGGTTAPAGGGTTAPAGGGTTAPSSSGAATGDTVEVKNFSFEPASLTVPTGTKVTWKFDDTAQHTVSDPTAKIMSQPLATGKSFSYTFTTAGTYNYICSIHQYMHGTVVVK